MSDKPSVYQENGKVIYRASALGTCIKALAAERMGYEPLGFDDNTLTLFREGHLHEVAIISELGNQVQRDSNQLEVKLPLTDKLWVYGHIDGILLEEGKRYLLEIKSMGDEAYKEFVKKGWEAPGLVQKYKWQISAYMIALDLECMLLAKNRNNGQQWSLVAEYPFHSLYQIRERVLKAEVIARTGRLPKVCSDPSFFCSFSYLHEGDKPEQLEDKALESLAIQYKRVDEELKATTERKKELRKALKNGMGEKVKVQVGRARVTFFEAKNPPTYNYEKMKEDGVEIEKYKEQGKSERLRVQIEEEGASMVEYAILLVFLCIVAGWAAGCMGLASHSVMYHSGRLLGK